MKKLVLISILTRGYVVLLPLIFSTMFMLDLSASQIDNDKNKFTFPDWKSLHKLNIEVLNRGTTIEVFLGKDDKIIDAQAAFDFFAPLTTTYFVKDVGHLLRG